MTTAPEPLTPADHDDDGPECETCGKTTCPDADLPGFSAPRDCAYAPVFDGLRYDRCEYGCGRDITNEAIRRDIVPVVDAMLAAARAESWDEGAEAMAEWSASYMHGDNGPPDPPVNPYEATPAQPEATS